MTQVSVPQLVLKYDQADSLVRILKLVDIGGVRNIQRGRILRLLKNEMELFDEGRQSLLMKEHAELDEDGNPVEIGGGIKLKSPEAWKKAALKLLKEAPLKIEVRTDADRSWRAFVEEILTTKLCPKITGDAAGDFDEILEAVRACKPKDEKKEDSAEAE